MVVWPPRPALPPSAPLLLAPVLLLEWPAASWPPSIMCTLRVLDAEFMPSSLRAATCSANSCHPASGPKFECQARGNRSGPAPPPPDLLRQPRPNHKVVCACLSSWPRVPAPAWRACQACPRERPKHARPATHLRECQYSPGLQGQASQFPLCLQALRPTRLALARVQGAQRPGQLCYHEGVWIKRIPWCCELSQDWPEAPRLDLLAARVPVQGVRDTHHELAPENKPPHAGWRQC